MKATYRKTKGGQMSRFRVWGWGPWSHTAAIVEVGACPEWDGIDWPDDVNDVDRWVVEVESTEAELDAETRFAEFVIGWDEL